MNYILKLQSDGYIERQHVLAATKWRDNYTRMFLAPSLFRIMHDAVIKGLGGEAIEAKHNLPARSAKAVVRMILTALDECEGIFFTSPNDAEDAFTVEREYLTGTNIAEQSKVMETFGLTATEARLFIVLRNSGKFETREAIHTRLYADYKKDAPDLKIIDVLICKMRPKLAGTGWVFDLLHGTGIRLKDTSST